MTTHRVLLNSQDDRKVIEQTKCLGGPLELIFMRPKNCILLATMSARPSATHLGDPPCGTASHAYSVLG